MDFYSMKHLHLGWCKTCHPYGSQLEIFYDSVSQNKDSCVLEGD